MNDAPKISECYRDRIIRCTQALALANHDAVREDLEPGMQPMMLKMFTDGNLDKRFLKLQDQMDLVAEAFDADEFENLIVKYVSTIPLDAYDTGCSDGEKFLRWLFDTNKLTDVQHDYIACQQGRYKVETIARTNRMAHIQFQDLCSLKDVIKSKWVIDLNLRIMLNPVHSWATLQTGELLDEDSGVPAVVIFFPVGNEIRTAILELECQALIRHLETFGSSRIDDLENALPDVGRDAISTLCQDVTSIGLTAFG